MTCTYQKKRPKKKTKPTKRRCLHDKQFHIISLDTFNVSVGIAVNMSEFEVIDEYRKRINKLPHRDIGREEQLFNGMFHEVSGWDACQFTAGRMCRFGNEYLIMVRILKHRHRVGWGVIAHELTHVVQYVTRDRRIPLTLETEEVHAYLMQHLIVEAMFALSD